MLGISYTNDYQGGDPSADAMDWRGKLMQRMKERQSKIASLSKFSVFGRGIGNSCYAVSRVLFHAEMSGHPPPAVLAELEKTTAALVDHKTDPTKPPGPRRFAGISGRMQRGRPADGGCGVLPFTEHIHARHAAWGARFVTARAAGLQIPWVQLAQHQLSHVLDRTAHPLDLLSMRPADVATRILPPPMRRMIQGLSSLPPMHLLNVDGVGTQPVPGDWCASAPLWNNPLLDLRRVGGGDLVRSMASRPCGQFLRLHGINTVGQLLHADAVIAPLTGATFTWPLRLSAFPVNTNALPDLYTCRGHVRMCLAQAPLPGWAAAVRQCAAPPPPDTACAQQALNHLGWVRPRGEDVKLANLTVRTATAMQLGDLEADRDARYAAFATLAHSTAGQPPPSAAAAAQTVRRLLAQLWRRVQVTNVVKDVFWRLVHNGLATAERRHTAAAAERREAAASASAEAAAAASASADAAAAVSASADAATPSRAATMQPPPAAAPAAGIASAAVAATNPAAPAAMPTATAATVQGGPGPPGGGELCCCGEVRNPGREHHYWECSIARAVTAVLQFELDVLTAPPTTATAAAVAAVPVAAPTAAAPAVAGRPRSSAAILAAFLQRAAPAAARPPGPAAAAARPPSTAAAATAAVPPSTAATAAAAALPPTAAAAAVAVPPLRTAAAATVVVPIVAAPALGPAAQPPPPVPPQQQQLQPPIQPLPALQQAQQAAPPAGQLQQQQQGQPPQRRLRATDVWLMLDQPGVDRGVWQLVCMSAIAAMDYGRRRAACCILHNERPQQAGPQLAQQMQRAAVARFWVTLAIFCTLSAIPVQWQRTAAGGPFISFDQQQQQWAVVRSGRVG